MPPAPTIHPRQHHHSSPWTVHSGQQTDRLKGHMNSGPFQAVHASFQELWILLFSQNRNDWVRIASEGLFFHYELLFSQLWCRLKAVIYSSRQPILGINISTNSKLQKRSKKTCKQLPPPFCEQIIRKWLCLHCSHILHKLIGVKAIVLYWDQGMGISWGIRGFPISLPKEGRRVRLRLVEFDMTTYSS